MDISTYFSSPPDKKIQHIFLMIHYFVPVQAYLIFQALSTKTGLGENFVARKGLGEGLMRGEEKFF